MRILRRVAIPLMLLMTAFGLLAASASASTAPTPPKIQVGFQVSPTRVVPTVPVCPGFHGNNGRRHNRLIGAPSPMLPRLLSDAPSRQGGCG